MTISANAAQTVCAPPPPPHFLPSTNIVGLIRARDRNRKLVRWCRHGDLQLDLGLGLWWRRLGFFLQDYLRRH